MSGDTIFGFALLGIGSVLMTSNRVRFVPSMFFLTAVTGLFLSHTAFAVPAAPIAVIAAEALGVSPYPFAVATCGLVLGGIIRGRR